MSAVLFPTGVVNRTILVVDDDAFVRSTVTQLLERWGYTVLPAESADQALTVAKTSHVDAFLLDMEMPGKSGTELCRNLRTLDAYKVTPILFVTGGGEQNYLVEAFAAGCDDFINKPVDAVVLQARLRGHLERLAYFEQLERARQTLNRYLSRRTREVAETASRTGRLAPPEQRDIVILFTDIRGFTALADEMETKKLFSVLSAQLAEQVDLVYEYGGYVDKFGGDGVMAVFDGDDKVAQSCLCALRIIDSARVNDSSGNEKIRQLGIGIHAGNAMIGNIGSPEHLDYSVIGTALESSLLAANRAVRWC